MGTKLRNPTLGLLTDGLSESEGAVSKAHSVDTVFVHFIFIGDSCSPSRQDQRGVVCLPLRAIFTDLGGVFGWKNGKFFYDSFL